MRAIFDQLMQFDTVSAKPNIDLMLYVQALLAEAGISATLIPDAGGAKANLFGDRLALSAAATATDSGDPAGDAGGAGDACASPASRPSTSTPPAHGASQVERLPAGSREGLMPSQRTLAARPSTTRRSMNREPGV